MHIAEGFLPPAWAAIWTVVAAPFVVHGGYSVVRVVKDKPNVKLLLVGMGAFTFVMSAIKLPSVTGSSSHPTGTGVGAILFRPPVMAFIGTVVLVFQALLLAHGGLTTLGANVVSMAVVGPWAGYGVFRLLRAFPLAFRVFLGVAVADLMTYLMTAIQLAAAFPDPASGFGGALVKFMAVFAITQIPLAIVEGLVGLLLFNALLEWARPELVSLGVVPADESADEVVEETSDHA